MPFMHIDKDGEDLAHLAVVQRSNGNISSGLYVYNEKTDETQVRNHLAIIASRDGSVSYEVASPAKFREAILAVQDAPGMYTNMEIPATSLGSQLGLLKFKCKNTGATAYSDHVITMIFNTNGISMFDSTSATTVWDVPVKNSLTFKGTFPYTDFNNYTVPTGIYYLDGTTRTNGPSQGYAWSHLIVINESTVVTQTLITGWNIFVRKRSGSPANWASWAACI